MHDIKYGDFFSKVDVTKAGWQTVYDVSVFTMQLLVFDNFVKAQFTPIRGCYQIRLMKKGREYLAQY